MRQSIRGLAGYGRMTRTQRFSHRAGLRRACREEAECMSCSLRFRTGRNSLAQASRRCG
jgi:hypothetical protein